LKQVQLQLQLLLQQVHKLNEHSVQLQQSHGNSKPREKEELPLEELLTKEVMMHKLKRQLLLQNKSDYAVKLGKMYC
jgi:hypothetical protein